MKVGTFKGVATDWGISKSPEKGTPQVFVTFSIAVDGELETLSWIGYLTDKTKERTIKTLYSLGFDGNFEGLVGGRDSGCLESGKEMSLSIVNEPYNGEDKFKIAWVNLPGEGGGMKRLEKSEAAKILDDLKADFLALKPKGEKKLDLPV